MPTDTLQSKILKRFTDRVQELIDKEAQLTSLTNECTNLKTDLEIFSGMTWDEIKKQTSGEKEKPTRKPRSAKKVVEGTSTPPPQIDAKNNDSNNVLIVNCIRQYELAQTGSLINSRAIRLKVEELYPTILLGHSDNYLHNMLHYNTKMGLITKSKPEGSKGFEYRTTPSGLEKLKALTTPK
jgi:hypothetical protein